MREDKIIDLVYENSNVWNDQRIGEFVRRGLTEDITLYDLEKDMGLNRERE